MKANTSIKNEGLKKRWYEDIACREFLVGIDDFKRGRPRPPMPSAGEVLLFTDLRYYGWMLERAKAIAFLKKIFKRMVFPNERRRALILEIAIKSMDRQHYLDPDVRDDDGFLAYTVSAYQTWFRSGTGPSSEKLGEDS